MKKERLIDRNGSTQEALEAFWTIIHRLEEISHRLDPLSAEMARTPRDAQDLLNKLFEYLSSLHTLASDTASQMDTTKELLTSIAREQQAQTARMTVIETLLREIHTPLSRTLG